MLSLVPFLTLLEKQLQSELHSTRFAGTGNLASPSPVDIGPGKTEEGSIGGVEALGSKLQSNPFHDSHRLGK